MNIGLAVVFGFALVSPVTAIAACPGSGEIAPSGEASSSEDAAPTATASQERASVARITGPTSCAEAKIGPFGVAAFLVSDKLVVRPLPGTVLDVASETPVTIATLDQKLRVDLFVTRGQAADRSPDFDCRFLRISPKGKETALEDLACEARSIPASDTRLHAANFRLAVRHQSGDEAGRWAIRLSIKEKYEREWTDLTLEYDFEAPGS